MIKNSSGNYFRFRIAGILISFTNTVGMSFVSNYQLGEESKEILPIPNNLIINQHLIWF